MVNINFDQKFPAAQDDDDAGHGDDDAGGGDDGEAF